MGSITGHKIDYDGARALRGQRHIPSKTEPKYLPRVACIEFGKDASFVFKNWKKPSKLTKHSQSENHVSCMTKRLQFKAMERKNSSVLQQLSSAHKEQVKINRKYLQVLIKCLISIAMQNISVRDHRRKSKRYLGSVRYKQRKLSPKLDKTAIRCDHRIRRSVKNFALNPESRLKYLPNPPIRRPIHPPLLEVLRCSSKVSHLI